MNFQKGRNTINSCTWPFPFWNWNSLTSSCPQSSPSCPAKTSSGSPSSKSSTKPEPQLGHVKDWNIAHVMLHFCINLCTRMCSYICKLRSPLIAFVTEVDGCRGVGRGPRPGAWARGRRHGRRRGVMMSKRLKDQIIQYKIKFRQSECFLCIPFILLVFDIWI